MVLCFFLIYFIHSIIYSFLVRCFIGKERERARERGLSEKHTHTEIKCYKERERESEKQGKQTFFIFFICKKKKRGEIKNSKKDILFRFNLDPLFHFRAVRTLCERGTHTHTRKRVSRKKKREKRRKKKTDITGGGKRRRRLSNEHQPISSCSPESRRLPRPPSAPGSPRPAATAPEGPGTPRAPPRRRRQTRAWRGSRPP